MFQGLYLNKIKNLSTKSSEENSIFIMMTFSNIILTQNLMLILMQKNFLFSYFELFYYDSNIFIRITYPALFLKSKNEFFFSFSGSRPVH